MPTAVEITRELSADVQRVSRPGKDTAITAPDGFRVLTAANNTVVTTDATATDLLDANGDAGIVIPDTHVAQVTARVLAVQTAGASGTPGDCSSWVITATVKRGVGVATIAHVDTAVELANVDAVAAAAWTAVLTVDTATGGVKVVGTGEANKTIKWYADISVNAIAYA